MTTFPKMTQKHKEFAALVLCELAQRKKESLQLYKPLESVVPFHASTKRERLVRGSNRAGKTLAAAVEIARAVCGRDPYQKYPLEKGRCWITATKEKELGEVIYPKLFTPSAFKVIQDEETKEWRVWEPWREYDKAHSEKARWAPPLIPERFIKTVSWASKKSLVPDKIILKNGWQMVFFSSMAKPTKGADVDLVWFDEEVLGQWWYEEITARLFDRKGRFIWSATPEASTEQLLSLHERSMTGDPHAEEFVLLVRDNPYFASEEIDIWERKLSRDIARTKIYGEYAIDAQLIFTEFDYDQHTCEPFPLPDDWTLYMAVDPGRQVCAVLFGAVPPPAQGDYFYIWDELYIEQADAATFAELVAGKAGNRTFREFYIDWMSARVREMGSGRKIQDQYAQALAARQIESEVTGSNFMFGSNDVLAGIEAIRGWLHIRPNGTCKVKIFRGCCDKLVDELRHYRYKRDPDGKITDKPIAKRDHAIWGLRAFAMRKPEYYPVKHKQKFSGAYASWLEYKRNKQRARSGNSSFIQLGPPL